MAAERRPSEPEPGAPGGGPARGAASRPPARWPMRRYLARFVAISVILFALYHLSESTRRFRYVNEANAALSGAVLHLVGVPNTRHGTTMQMPGGGMEIISECSAIYVVILFTAGVLAFPASWRARLGGLGLGLPCIFVVNVLRLATLGAIIQHRAALLPLFHEYLWQVFFVLLTAALYVAWIERIVLREGARPTA